MIEATILVTRDGNTAKRVVGNARESLWPNASEIVGSQDLRDDDGEIHSAETHDERLPEMAHLTMIGRPRRMARQHIVTPRTHATGS
jgi:hypothetical protein